jgi:hypothetical protein
MGCWQWFTGLWPGLSRLWHQGAWDALAVAGLFGMLVNVGIYLEWVIPQEVAWPVRWLAWSVVIVFWVFAQRRETRLQQRGFSGGDEQHERLLREAQKAYLQRQWADAERLVRRLLAEVPEDREARLLLIGILRRTGRRREALSELRRLAGVPGSQKWRWEMDKERTLLEGQFTPTMNIKEEDNRSSEDSELSTGVQRAAA